MVPSFRRLASLKLASVAPRRSSSPPAFQPRISTPGRRVYAQIKGLGQFYNGLGVKILSTPQGVMADHKAKAANVGGEVLCQVF